MAELLEQDVLNADAHYSNPVKHVAKCRTMTTALKWQAGTAAAWPLHREGTCQSFLLPVDAALWARLDFIQPRTRADIRTGAQHSACAGDH
jgi:hypothetical protein